MIRKPECCAGCYYNSDWKRCDLEIFHPDTKSHVCDVVCQNKDECLFHNPNEEMKNETGN